MDSSTRGLESEVRILRASAAKHQAEFQNLEKKYYEMYKSREEWQHYSEQLKISCKHLEEELKRRDAANVTLSNNVEQLTGIIDEQEGQIKSLMAERNSIFQKMTEYNRKLHEKESLIAALRSTNLDSMKGAVKVTSSSFCCNEEVGVRDLSNIAAFDVLVNRNLPIRSSNEQLDGFIFCLLEHISKYSAANGNEVVGILYLRPIVELFCRHALDTMKRNHNKLIWENENRVTTTQPAADNLKRSAVIKIRRASKKLKELDDTIRCCKRSQLINSYKQNFINCIKSSKSDELNLALDKIAESVFQNSDAFQSMNNRPAPKRKGILKAPSVSSSAHCESDNANVDLNGQGNWAVVNTSGKTSSSTSILLSKRPVRSVRFNLPEKFSPIKRCSTVKKSIRSLAHGPPSKYMRFGNDGMQKENRTLERKRQTDEFDHSYAGLDVNEILYQ